MAAYLAGFPSESAQQSKRSPANGTETRADAAKQQTRRQSMVETAERPQTASSQPSGEPLTDITEVSPAPPVADLSVAPAPPPKPALEAFEE
jgi:hypothetical protein